jgi:hypothetical protein
MERATVYLPADSKRGVARAAAARGVSAAELIREALRAALAGNAAPRPRLRLFASGRPRLAERVGQALAGFGDD